jgi:plastocyanin
VSGCRTRLLIALATGVLMVVTLSGMAGASPARGVTTTIRAIVPSTYSSPTWSPNRVRIDRGTQVTWVAVTFDHTVTAYGGNWSYQSDLAEGASVTRRFGHAGIYRYRCTIHSTLVNDQCQGMCGKIVVH